MNCSSARPSFDRANPARLCRDLHRRANQLGTGAYRLHSSRLQSFDGRRSFPVHQRTTPWIAFGPKWALAGVPIVNVMFEYLTLLPPRTQIVTGDGLPNGTAAPLLVTNAVPVIAKPSVTAGANAGQRAGQSRVTTPSV